VCVTEWGSFETRWFIELYSRLQIICEEMFGTGCVEEPLHFWDPTPKFWLICIYYTLRPFLDCRL